MAYEGRVKDSGTSIDSLTIPLFEVLAHLPPVTSPSNPLLDAVILKANKIEVNSVGFAFWIRLSARTDACVFVDLPNSRFGGSGVQLSRSCNPAGTAPSSTSFLLAVSEINGSASYVQMCSITGVGLAASALMSRLQLFIKANSPASDIDFAPAVPNMNFSLALSIQKADFGISICSEHRTIPLLLASVAAIRLDFAFDVLNSLVQACASFNVGIQSYCWVKRGWEPLLEPWRTTLHLDCRARR